MRWRVVVAALLAGLLPAGADPAADAERWARRGNAAFERGDYAAAVDCYTRAEERITDPGLVAFNQAAALYRLGRYREAELHYRRCRDAAAGGRLARTLYDLGNAVVQQARDRSAARLEEAIGCYEECLRQEPDDALAANARSNLGLARALLVRAKANPDRPPGDRAADPNRPEPDDERAPYAEAQPGADRADAASPGAKRQRTDRADDATASDQVPPPGKGNVRVLTDPDGWAALSAEETAAVLEQVAARVRRERVEHRRGLAPRPAPGFPDW
jgi:tetratricopeptide (TPR) repeat protein